MNNKGFMMAEVVVVSAIIMVTLVGIYISYNKILSVYNQRVDYYDTKTLYKLAEIRDHSNIELPDIDVCTNIIGNLTCHTTKDKIIENKVVLTSSVKQTYKDYLEYLSDGIELSDEADSFLIMERCVDQDNCKYAYLEVFNNEETPE